MKRPVIPIALEPIDKFLLGLTLLGMLFLFGLPFFYYGSLPDEIQMHFNFFVKANPYRSKAAIWILPVIGLLVTGLLVGLSRFPHTFFYPVNITEKNALFQYRNAIRTMYSMAAFITVSFTFVVFETIRVALGKQDRFFPLFLPIYVGVILFLLRSCLKTPKMSTK